MFRFTIRDVLWLMVVVGLGCGWILSAQSSALQEARLRASEREIEQLKTRIEEVASENATNSGIVDALFATFHQADLSENQRTEIRNIFAEQLEQRGIEIQTVH